MAAREVRSHPFDMSLRLWSDMIPLDDLVARLRLSVRHLHRLGEPMGTIGPSARRVADQHYASLDDAEGADVSDVAAWIGRIVRVIEPIDPLVEALKAERIDGVLWIAVLGREPTPTPEVSADLIEAVTQLGLRLFLENYSTWDGEGDAPQKIWLPGPAPSGAMPELM